LFGDIFYDLKGIFPHGISLSSFVHGAHNNSFYFPGIVLEFIIMRSIVQDIHLNLL
jgi:hypothetical protein